MCTLLHNNFWGGTYDGIVCAQTSLWMPIFMMLWEWLLHVALHVLESRNVASGFLALRNRFARRVTFTDALQRIKFSIPIATSRFIVQATAGLHNFRRSVEAILNF